MVKYANGTIRLAPLYDFAPMFLDDQGIAGTCPMDRRRKGGNARLETGDGDTPGFSFRYGFVEKAISRIQSEI